MGKGDCSRLGRRGLQEKLLADPTAVLKDNGIDFPEGMIVRLVEDKEGEVTIPFPAKPSDLLGEPEALQERVQAVSLFTMSA